MPMWRCPHCGTPQAETARCWVCRRSSTACGTCRNFRHSVAGSLGYCGLDRGRQPLAGDEIRACWEAWPAGAEPTHATPLTIAPAIDGVSGAERVPPLAFVEVLDGAAAGPSDVLAGPPLVTGPPEAPAGPPEGPAAPIRAREEPGWSLWSDLER